MASQVIAGMDGVSRQLDPGAPEISPYECDKPKMPASLMDAVAALDQSTLFRKAFGDAYIDYILAVKQCEIDRFLNYVTDWEQREYFEVF